MKQFAELPQTTTTTIRILCRGTHCVEPFSFDTSLESHPPVGIPPLPPSKPACFGHTSDLTGNYKFKPHICFSLSLFYVNIFIWDMFCWYVVVFSLKEKKRKFVFWYFVKEGWSMIIFCFVEKGYEKLVICFGGEKIHLMWGK